MLCVSCWDYLEANTQSSETPNLKSIFTKKELDQIIFHTDNLDLLISEEKFTNQREGYLNIVDLFLNRIGQKLFQDEALSITKAIDARLFFVNDGYLCQYAINKNDRSILSDDRIKGGFLYFAALYNRAKLLVNGGCDRDAQRDLKKALSLTEEFLNPWLTIFVLLQKEGYGNSHNSPFYDQLQGKISFVNMLRSSIEQNINVLEDNKNKEGKYVVTDGSFIEEFVPKGENDDEGIKGLDNAECNYWHNICLGNLFGIEFLPPPPSPWNYIGMFMLGIGQTVLGCLAACTGYGAYFAKDFIMQGFSDIWQSFRSGFAGKAIDWGSYWLGKGINYGISLVSAGVSKCMSYIKGGAEAATVANTARQSVGQVLVQGAKKFAVGQVISSTASFITDKVLENFLDEIKGKVSGRIDTLMAQGDFISALEQSIKVSKMQGHKKDRLRAIVFTKEWLGSEEASIWTSSLSRLVQTSMDSVHTIAGTATRLALAGKDLTNLISFLDRYELALTDELIVRPSCLFDLFWVRYRNYSTFSLVKENIVKKWFDDIVCKGLFENKDSGYCDITSWRFYRDIRDSSSEMLYKNISFYVTGLSTIQNVDSDRMNEISRILSDVTHSIFEYDLFTRESDIRFVKNYLVQTLMGTMNGKIQSLTTPWVESGLHGVYSAIETNFFKQPVPITRVEEDEEKATKSLKIFVPQDDSDNWSDVQEFEDDNLLITGDIGNFDSIELVNEYYPIDNLPGEYGASFADLGGESFPQEQFETTVPKQSDRGVVGSTADYLDSVVNRPDSPPKMKTGYSAMKDQAVECIPDSIREGLGSLSEKAQEGVSSVFSKLSEETRGKIADGFSVLGNTMEMLPTGVRRGVRSVGVSQETSQMFGEVASDAVDVFAAATGVAAAGKIIFKSGKKVVGRVALTQSRPASSAINKVRLSQQLRAQEMSRRPGHGFSKHGKEFDCKKQSQFEKTIERHLNHRNTTTKNYRDGRRVYRNSRAEGYSGSSNGGTFFKREKGYQKPKGEGPVPERVVE